MEVMKSSGTPVLVVQAGSFGKYVGYLKVNFDNNGRVTFWFGNPVLMDSSIPESAWWWWGGGGGDGGW